MTETVLVVHGGAGRLPRKRLQHPRRRLYEEGLARSLKVGQKVLLRGGSSLNAVTEAVAVLEDLEIFNAGRGAALCLDGSVELSASVMRGNDLGVGAVVGMKRTKNPIRAARALVGHAHGFLFGPEADIYASSRDLELVSSDYFLTSMRQKQWERYKNKRTLALDHSDDEAVQGTVGAVALDRRGNLAAATSTGGLVNQQPGRIGDSPVVGAGTWADNGTCAISATGTGEAFARLAFARRVADLVELGSLTIEDAAIKALSEVEAVKGIGGCIIVNRQGHFSLPFNSAMMLRGWTRGKGPAHVAILPNENILCG